MPFAFILMPLILRKLECIGTKMNCLTRWLFERFQCFAWKSSLPSFNEQNNISFLSFYFFISEMLITLMGFLWQDTEINDYFHF